MYEPYPVSDPPPQLERARPARTVLSAVRLMYAGAALEVVALIVGVVIWLVGLAVMVLIFNKDSGPFYRQAGRGGTIARSE